MPTSRRSFFGTSHCYHPFADGNEKLFLYHLLLNHFESKNLINCMKLCLCLYVYACLQAKKPHTHTQALVINLLSKSFIIMLRRLTVSLLYSLNIKEKNKLYTFLHCWLDIILVCLFSLLLVRGKWFSRKNLIFFLTGKKSICC